MSSQAPKTWTQPGLTVLGQHAKQTYTTQYATSHMSLLAETCTMLHMTSDLHLLALV